MVSDSTNGKVGATFLWKGMQDMQIRNFIYFAIAFHFESRGSFNRLVKNWIHTRIGLIQYCKNERISQQPHELTLHASTVGTVPSTHLSSIARCLEKAKL